MRSTYQEYSEVIAFLNENVSNLNQVELLNEDARMSLSAIAVDKILDMTLAKYSKVDFTDIEKSRGDATNCKYYKNLRDSIDILCDIDMKSGKIPQSLTVSTALNNLVNLKKNFMYAFRTKNTLAIMLYNTTYYSIMEATSYLIATSVDYVKNGNKMEVVPHTVDSKEVLLLNNLVKFNNEVTSGKVLKFINYAHETEEAYEANKEVINESAIVLNEADGFFTKSVEAVKKVVGLFIEKKTDATGKDKHRLTKIGVAATAITAGAALIYLMVNIIPIIKSCIYVIYNIRHKISEAARIQAELIELNIELMKENGEDEDTIDKQQKSADFFRRISDKFALSCDKANNDAKKEQKDEKIDPDDVVI